MFNTVRDLPDHERQTVLDRHTCGNAPMRAAVQRLLDAERSPLGERLARCLDDALVDLDDALVPNTNAQSGTLPEIGDRYDAVRLLGSGSTGDVYLADQLQPVHRQVAIKVLRPSEVRASTVERMRREAMALSALDHPGIATIYDAGVTRDGRPYLATEWVDGPPIDRWCEENAATFVTRCELLASVCRAVEHAHQRGVIHRDLKPGNILVRDGEGGPTPKLVDLGIARLLEPHHGPGLSLTRGGHLLGTIGYIAPEQLEGGAADVRSDLFALGRVLEGLLGGLPAPPSPLSHTDVRAIIACATAADPRDRYQSAGAMADDLEAALAGRTVAARRPTPFEAAIRIIRRNPGATAAIAASVLAVSIAGGIAIDRSVARAQALRDRASVLDLQKSLLNDTLDGIVLILGRYAGTIDQRASMADRLDGQLRSMLALTPEDRDLRVLLARVGTERARIALAQGKPELAESLASAAAETMRREIDPATAPIGAVRKLGLAVVVHGDCLAGQRDYDQAEQAYRWVLELHQRARERFPDHIGLLDDLSWSLDRFSQPVPDRMLEAASAPTPWLDVARARLELAEKLLELDSERYLSRFNLAVAHMKFGRLHVEHDDDRAERHLTIAREMLEGLCQEDPGRTSVHAYLGSTLRMLSELYDRRGHESQVVPAMERAVLALIGALGSHPGSDARLSEHLRNQAQILADLYARHGRHDEIQPLWDRVDAVAPE